VVSKEDFQKWVDGAKKKFAKAGTPATSVELAAAR
jgi:hypothetical protein